MSTYDEIAARDLELWLIQVKRPPTLFDSVSKGLQNKINKLIPEKAHKVITVAIEKMVKAVLFGAKFSAGGVRAEGSLQLREAFVKERITFYSKTASAEGAVTGAGGILLGLADFPILIGIKVKLLFDIAGIYGFDTRDYRERLFILYIFQLTFSSQQARLPIIHQLEEWEKFAASLPDDQDRFDWRTFQQEYRDYIDLAKMAQLIPVVGAAVGAVVNYRLLQKLGRNAVNCYRLRLLDPRPGLRADNN